MSLVERKMLCERQDVFASLLSMQVAISYCGIVHVRVMSYLYWLSRAAYYHYHHHP